MKEKKYRIRQLHHKSTFPKENIVTDFGLVTKCDGDGVYYSSVPIETSIKPYQYQMYWAIPEEIRFWSALALSTKTWDGIFCLVPGDEALTIDIINRTEFEGLNKFDWHDTIEYPNDYDLFVRDVSLTKINQLLNRIDLQNLLLIRGLSCWLKGWVLKTSRHIFMEEAILMEGIALESAVELLRLQLSNEGKPATQKEVHKYVRGKFHGKDYWPEMFETEIGKVRDQLKHPRKSENKGYGVPDLIGEEFFESYEMLKSIFHLVVMGEVLELS